MRFLFCLLLLLFGCKSGIDLDELWNDALIFRQNSNLKDSITCLKKIIEKGKEKSLLVKAQYQLADIYLNDVNNYTFAVDEFEKLIDNYPDSEFAKKSIFMLGYINSNYIQSYDDAIMYYNMFLNKYPDDDLVHSVEYELELLDSSGIIESLDRLRVKSK